MKIFYALLICPLFADASLHNFEKNGISYEWESHPNPVVFEKVVVESVYDCYEQIPRSVLGIDSEVNMRAWIAETWLKILDEMHDPRNKLHLLVAKKEKNPVGYAFFDLKEYPHVYISEIVVDPRCKRQGIAKELVFCIMDQLPNVTRVSVMTRKANFQACAFYEALGFQSASFIKEGYDENLFKSFVLIPQPNSIP